MLTFPTTLDTLLTLLDISADPLGGLMVAGCKRRRQVEGLMPGMTSRQKFNGCASRVIPGK
jgi:hypothetical protein